MSETSTEKKTPTPKKAGRTRGKVAAKKKAASKPRRGDAAIGDAAVKAKTGRTWDEWFAVLDKAGAKKMTHKAIAKLVATRHKLPGWWAQMLTVGYERARGMRKVNETLSGFRTSVSRTFDAGVDAAFDAWDSAKSRAAFLKEKVDFSARNPGKNLRFAWKVGRVEVQFIVKNAKKTQITVEHQGLKNESEVSKVKAQWTKAMDKLGTRLQQAGGRLKKV